MDDLISRKALLEKIWEQGHEHPNAYQLTRYAELVVSEAPSVEAEPKRGRWDEKYKGCFNPYVCSVCRSCNNIKNKYCPNCGAKMDGGNEDV